jgi:hypothetical protein
MPYVPFTKPVTAAQNRPLFNFAKNGFFEGPVVENYSLFKDVVKNQETFPKSDLILRRTYAKIIADSIACVPLKSRTNSGGGGKVFDCVVSTPWSKQPLSLTAIGGHTGKTVMFLATVAPGDEREALIKRALENASRGNLLTGTSYHGSRRP